MDERAVVTCFLRHGTEVLLVCRSDAVGSYRERWGGVSGYAEGTPEAAARWEIDEEVGLLDAVEFVRSADVLEVEDEDRGTRWLVHPFLFDCSRTDIDPNEEIADHEWVQPPGILDRATVPRLWDAYRAVAPTVGTVADDDEHGSAYLSVRALEVLRDAARPARAASTLSASVPPASTSAAASRSTSRARTDRYAEPCSSSSATVPTVGATAR